MLIDKNRHYYRLISDMKSFFNNNDNYKPFPVEENYVYYFDYSNNFTKILAINKDNISNYIKELEQLISYCKKNNIDYNFLDYW